MAQSSRVIEVVDLVKRFGDHTAVDRVSFSANEGEVFGLLGPNGEASELRRRLGFEFTHEAVRDS